MAASPANVSARQRPQCTRLRRLMAQIALASVTAASTKNAMEIEPSIGIAISARRKGFGVQPGARYHVGAANDRTAKEPASGDCAREGPSAAVMPERSDHQIDKREWHEEFPRELHQLIHAQSRHGGADPDENGDERSKLQEEPEPGGNYIQE